MFFCHFSPFYMSELPVGVAPVSLPANRSSAGITGVPGLEESGTVSEDIGNRLRKS
jgi:hypothetical protein